MGHIWQTWEIVVSIVLCTLSISFSISFMIWTALQLRKMRLCSQEPPFDMQNPRGANQATDNIELGTQSVGVVIIVHEDEINEDRLREH